MFAKLQKFTVALALSLLVLPTFNARAEFVDLAISASSIRFSESTLIAQQTVRIYATITNVGDVDSSAQVFFYRSDELIGKSQIVSVLAGGAGDDVYVDLELPEGLFNIRAVIQGADPADSNPANDEAITPLFRAYPDADGDGVIDDHDNCVNDENADQEDSDHDGQGDVCDSDRDGDGVLNGSDDYPDDPARSELPKSVPTPTLTPSPAPVTVENETPTEASVLPTPASEEEVEDGPLPEPEVLGEEDLVIPGSLSFSTKRITWRTYEFAINPVVGEFDLNYSWNFGDGTTSAQETVTHTFPGPGIYDVSLGRITNGGDIDTTSQTTTISFFNLDNPILLGTLSALILILLGLAWLIFRLRRGREV